MQVKRLLKERPRQGRPIPKSQVVPELTRLWGGKWKNDRSKGLLTNGTKQVWYTPGLGETRYYTIAPMKLLFIVEEVSR